VLTLWFSDTYIMMAFQIAIGVSKFGIIYVLVNSAFENDVGRLLYQAFSDN
jgi:hypothetical protein